MPPLLTRQGANTTTCPRATAQCCATAKKNHHFIISKLVTLLLGSPAQHIPTRLKHRGTVYAHSCVNTDCDCNKGKVGTGRRLRTDPVCSQDNVSPKASLGFLDSVLLLKIYGLRKLPEPGSLDLPPFQPRVYQDKFLFLPPFVLGSWSLRSSVLRLPKPALTVTCHGAINAPSFLLLRSSLINFILPFSCCRAVLYSALCHLHAPQLLSSQLCYPIPGYQTVPFHSDRDPSVLGWGSLGCASPVGPKDVPSSWLSHNTAPREAGRHCQTV